MFQVLSCLSLISFLVCSCGEAPEGSALETDEPSSVASEGADSDPSQESLPDEITALTDCDAVAGDCPSPAVLRSGDVLTVFFDYVVDGQEAKEFSATGTSPQVALSPVMVGAQGAGDRASIEVTAHALGEATVDIVIWYGENKDIERTYNLLVSIIE